MNIIITMIDAITKHNEVAAVRVGGNYYSYFVTKLCNILHFTWDVIIVTVSLTAQTAFLYWDGKKGLVK